MPAGKYKDRLTWQQPTELAKSSLGAETATYVDDQSGTGLWTSVEELTTGEKLALGATVTDQKAKVHVHNHPSISRQDRLIDRKRDCIYTIEGIQWAEDELILTVKRQQGIR